MPGPTGLSDFAAVHPSRCFDVGIAEQHAVTSAAGLAMGGAHPVVAVYATFLNRAYDQVLMDVALHNLPVTFVLDRAGITGDDGASHNGMWDLPLLAGIPGMRVAAPRDAATLTAALGEALSVSDGPTTLRFPKGSLPDPLPALRRSGAVDVLAEWGSDVLLVGVGPMGRVCVEAGQILVEEGIAATVVDPRWVLPVSESLADLARTAPLVVCVEDGSRQGGVGSAIATALAPAPVLSLGVAPQFLAHGTRASILTAQGLTPEGIAESVSKALVSLDS